jgi:hypothetical protein
MLREVASGDFGEPSPPLIVIRQQVHVESGESLRPLWTPALGAGHGNREDPAGGGADRIRLALDQVDVLIGA